MSAPKPPSAREPDCIHDEVRPGKGWRQPASACRICKDGPELRAHLEAWTAWLAENPDSPEARWVRDHP